MCWWKVHSKYRKCTIFLHILRLICFVREKWLKEFLRKLTVHCECYIIWWEKWQRRQRLKDSFVFGFHYYGNNITFHPSSSSNIVSSFNPCCYFFFIHAFRYKQIEIFDNVLAFFFLFFFCVHVYTDFDFWQLHVTIIIVWITYTYSRYIYFYGVFLKCCGRRDSKSHTYSS